MDLPGRGRPGLRPRGELLKPPPTRARLRQLIEQHGRASTSFQTLGPGLTVWMSPRGDAAACYVPTGASWVVAGEPLCPPERLSEVLQELAADAAAADRRLILFAAEQPAVDAARGAGPRRFTWVKIGEQPALDPASWTLAGRERRSLRAQVSRAANHGVTVRAAAAWEVEPGGPLRRACQRLMDAWRESRPMSIMGFLVDLRPFDEPEARRYFVAQEEGELVGLLAAAPIPARSGWFLEDIIRHPEAPNGTAEALIHHALTALAEEGARFATLGLAPLSGPPSPPEDRAPAGVRPWLPWLFHLAYRFATPLYSFAGLRAFRDKLRPEGWEPVYLVVSPPVIAPRVVWDMLSAFVPGSRVGFALDTAVRVIRAGCRRVPAPAWGIAAWAFSLALIPWIALLLAVDPHRSFGAAWMPWAWVSFDAAMAVLFAALATALARWPRFAGSLARVMFGAVLADLWLTSAQVWLFNLPQARAPVDVLTGVVAVLAPLSAALYLALLTIHLKPGRG